MRYKGEDNEKRGCELKQIFKNHQSSDCRL